MRIYTRKGDDGSTGMLFGGRTAKDESGPEAYGTVDEAVAALGIARALTAGDVADAIVRLQRDLFVVGAELATLPENRSKLRPGESLTTPEMVTRLETEIDAITDRRGQPTEFVVPGGTPLAAAIDVARTVVRRAERRAVSHHTVVGVEGSFVVPYLNRLADLLYMMARDAEDEWTPTKQNNDDKE